MNNKTRCPRMDAYLYCSNIIPGMSIIHMLLLKLVKCPT